ncbi:MAG: hypothetical protein RI926_1310 [Actinomycetota bacterium]|jgi:hypothetical protein
MQSVYVQSTTLQPWQNKNKSCFESMIRGLVHVIENLSLTELIGNRTRGIHKAMEDGRLRQTPISWGKSAIVDSSSGISQKSIFKLDGVGNCICGKHKIGIILCLNNREAIGTNFLKAELSDRFFASNNKDEESACVLLCLSRETLNLGGWDKSYADATEYIEAFRGAYSNFIKSPISVLEVHAP